MKRLIIWLAAVVGIVVIADLCVGALTKWYVRNYDLGGDYTSFDHMLKDFREENLVLGSSLALNSLDTKLMTDSLGTTFYNGSSNGQDLPFFLTVLRRAVQADSLKRVILGLRPEELEGTGKGTRYNFLAPYYHLGYDEIDEGLEGMSPQSRIFLQSNLYRLNTIWFRILLYRFITPNEVGENGFIAKPVPPSFPSKKTIEDAAGVSGERMSEFIEFIDLCSDNGVELVVFFPPQYYDYPQPTRTMQVVDSICGSKGIAVYNDLAHSAFAADSTLFFDNAHLNRDGARKYTELFMEYLTKPQNNNLEPAR